jgi:hypothetical protein
VTLTVRRILNQPGTTLWPGAKVETGYQAELVYRLACPDPDRPVCGIPRRPGLNIRVPEMSKIFSSNSTTLNLIFRRWLQKFQHHTPTYVAKDR